MKHRLSLRLTAVFLLLIALTGVVIPADADRGLPVLQGDIKARLPELFDAGDEVNAAPEKLQVGGDTFGIRLFTEGVVVVGVSDGGSPAANAGLKKKDRILSANGKEVHTADEFTKIVEQSEGNPISLAVERGSETLTLPVAPVKDEKGKYRIGVWIRDSAAGIGTITFLNPGNGAFGGLGHGICDSDTGALLPLSRGAVMETEIREIVKGAEGTPGELRGTLGSEKIGTIIKNCEMGVFGIISPEKTTGETLEVAGRDAVHAGPAILRCTLGADIAQDYHVELSDISRGNTGTKCFSVHVTDPTLIAKTGGIIQGMSGSPIIQDGRLVGAVTHVLIGDPTRGYGIFLENMLSALPDTLS